MVKKRKKIESHGMSGSPEYKIWQCIHQRCSNPNNTAFGYYGGRGISVCEAWHEFSKFFEDMGYRPTPHHSIDRIDTNGNYEPNNCRWATKREQQYNTRRVVITVVVDGKVMLLREIEEVSGLKRCSFNGRLTRGMTPEDAISRPRYYRPNTASQYVGVSWDKSTGKWIAKARISGKQKYLGRFDNEVDAAFARDVAVYAERGDSTDLNFKVSEIHDRFPEMFEAFLSRNRDVSVERAVLEGEG